MEQNIHMLQEAIINPEIHDEFRNDNLVTSGEIKNQPSDEDRSPLNIGKRTVSCDILSPKIIESYSLHPSILQRSSILESHRAKMHMWIMQNCHIRGLSFKTASLACYILDLFFSKGHNCSLEDLHQHGICSLRIANKLEDNIFIPINYEIFNRQKLIEIQAQLCLKINFELNPLTFTDIATCLNYLWNAFRSQTKSNGLDSQDLLKNNMSVEEKAKVINLELSFILLHETLELLYLILATFSFPIDQIVFNTFYMILCLQFHDNQKLLTSSKINAFMRRSPEMNKIMTQFTKFCRESNYQLRLDIDEGCLMYIYPVYNSLISENIEAKRPKDQEKCFDPNDTSLRLSQNIGIQTMKFKNKKGSLKKYLKRQIHQNLRKCSELTRL